MPDTKAQTVVNEARELAARTESWIAFSNALTDPESGLIAKVFPKPRERQAFFNSPQYEEVNQLLLGLIKRLGIRDNAVPSKSGKFIVRVPKTVHKALELEAEQEGVSLNQLASAKLATSLRQSAGVTEIVEAFRQVHGGYSSDRVVVDPDFNVKFLKQCRALGMTPSDFQLNHSLFDVRKSTKMFLPKTTKVTRFEDHDDYDFASELAFRYLQRRDGVSLDRVLCDPDIRSAFDEIARRLAPAQSVLKLRWAALNLRKSHRLKPPKTTANQDYDLVSAGLVARVNIMEVPTLPGIYALYDTNRPVFAGETEKLRGRIERHLSMAPSRGLPDWLDVGTSDLELKYHVAPAVGRQERLNWLMRFVNREKPLLNYQTAA